MILAQTIIEVIMNDWVILLTCITCILIIGFCIGRHSTKYIVPYWYEHTSPRYDDLLDNEKDECDCDPDKHEQCDNCSDKYSD